MIDKYQKEFIGSWIVVVIMIGMILVPVSNINAEIEGDYEYKENDDGTVTIIEYKGNARDLEIPGKIDGKVVTSIGEMAFYRKGLTSVKIPESVMEIGERAFSYNDIEKINIPNQLEIIESGVFNSNNLTQITIPKRVKEIKNNAFMQNSLKTITIPENVRVIEYQAFYVNYLTSIVLPKNVNEVGNAAFANTNITSVTIYNKKLDIGKNAFGYLPNQSIFGYLNSTSEAYVNDMKRAYENIEETDKMKFIALDSPPIINILLNRGTITKDTLVKFKSDVMLDLDYNHDIAKIKNITWKIDGKEVGNKETLNVSQYTDSIGEKKVTLIVETEFGGIAEKEITFFVKLLNKIKSKFIIDGNTATVVDDQIGLIEQEGIMTIDLSEYSENIREIKLDQKQIEELIRKKAMIQIQKENVMLNIPSINLRHNQALSLIINQLDPSTENLPNIKDAYGAIYDFTIKQGDSIISSFDQPIELVFSVGGVDSNIAEELRVYYWNEHKEKWKLVGGKYKNGNIHVSTNHFSKFGLFHPSVMKDEVSVTGQKLPETATKSYHMIMIGSIILLLGIITYIWRRYLQMN